MHMATDETLVEIRNFKGLKIVYKKKKQRNIQELRNFLSSTIEMILVATVSTMKELSSSSSKTFHCKCD